LVIFGFLCILPRLLLQGLDAKDGTKREKMFDFSSSLPVHVDLVNLFRVVAIWNTTCFHFEISFPFASLAEFIRGSFWPKDEGVVKEVFRVRTQTCLEGLYLINSLFLVLQCNGWRMLCQRLLRKVGRQLLVLYSIVKLTPMILYTSSPINCVNVPNIHPNWRPLHFFFGNRDWNWAFLMDMRIFLFFGFCGVLRQHLPFALPATCLVYWAHLIGRAVREGPCPFAVFEELESHTYWTTHFSFWMNWFPTALLLLNLDTCLRQPTAIYLMGRLKQIFGRLLIFFVAAMLLMSFCIGTVPMLRQDWQKLGFSKCPMIDGGNCPSIPYVLAGLPFHITVFISLHLASAPALGWPDDHDHLQVPLQVPLAFLCEAFRHTSFAFNAWHFRVVELVRTRWLAWLELMTMAQKEDDPSTMEVQLLFMMPLVMGTFGLAWMTYHSLEKSWMKVFYLVSQRCPLFLLYSASAGYCLMNFGLWYRDGFAWTVRVEQL